MVLSWSIESRSILIKDMTHGRQRGEMKGREREEREERKRRGREGKGRGRGGEEEEEERERERERERRTNNRGKRGSRWVMSKHSLLTISRKQS